MAEAIFRDALNLSALNFALVHQRANIQIQKTGSTVACHAIGSVPASDLERSKDVS